jgi:hypothetical protein
VEEDCVQDCWHEEGSVRAATSNGTGVERGGRRWVVPFTTSFTHAGSAKTSRVYSGGLLGSILAFAGFRVEGVETRLVKYSWWTVEGVDTTAPVSRGAREKERKASRIVRCWCGS